MWLPWTIHGASWIEAYGPQDGVGFRVKRRKGVGVVSQNDRLGKQMCRRKRNHVGEGFDWNIGRRGRGYRRTSRYAGTMQALRAAAGLSGAQGAVECTPARRDLSIWVRKVKRFVAKPVLRNARRASQKQAGLQRIERRMLVQNVDATPRSRKATHEFGHATQPHQYPHPNSHPHPRPKP